ncbi:hypothetical protein I302_108148 [Kwoniella bestiolae CBS 10118]|uniref:TPX2 C-terminal domain-containing protein n=1 Tax=Kwoniella bestiolae CBS 10118 TaxID=1296100 RepID=A0A1B9FWJ1_9TREE|nr:hypothetical protein I302_07486 [Kwoniella bestiolae CBS 10118]OCF23134.1 hypothetical protein I302_07486 [Kwoniella bestiolae CBS 10118]
MPMDPPQTPWVGLPRFQDESLLLNAEPIFEDSFDGSKGDGLDDWAEDTPQSSKMNVVDSSLDLGDYLPEEDDQSGHGIPISQMISVSDAVEEFRPPKPTEKELVQPVIEHMTHKREGSQSLIPIAGPSKKTKPPISREKNDDFYSRRLSDSTRRNSSTNLHDLHSSLQVSQASSSRLPKPKKTASSRLKASLHTSTLSREKQQVDGLGADGYIQKHTTVTRIPQIPEKPRSTISALSRYLAKSDALQPSLPQNTTSPIALLTANQNEQMPDHSTTQKLSDTKDDSTFTSHRHHSPFSLASTISETSSSHTYTTDRPESVDESSSRRSSMSEKIVGFLSNLLTRSISSSSLRDEVSTAGKEEEDKGDDAVKWDQDRDGTVKMDQDDTVDPKEIEEEHVEANITTNSSITQARNPIASSHHSNHPARIVPLTKPVPFSRPLHIRSQPRSLNGSTDPQSKESVVAKAKPRPLQPSRSSNVSPSSRHPSINKVSSSTSISSNTETRKPTRPITNSAFVSAALAKLPPPGKGHSSSLSNQPVTVKPTERVRDLNERKNVFERLASSSTTVNSATHHPRPSKSMKGSNLTVPIRGHTPGRASNARLAQRAKFDAIVLERQREKERIAEEQRRKREEEEEEEYMRRRKETVVWARPVPEMYRR